MGYADGVDTSDGFVLRQPRFWRIVQVLAFPVWIGWMVFIFRDEGEWPPVAFLVVGVLMLLYGAVMTVRMTRLSVVATADGLVVHNPYGTHRIPRSDITGFSYGRHQRFGRRALLVDRRAGSPVRLLAVEPAFRTLRDPNYGPVKERLEAWRTGAGAPVR